MSVLPLNLIKGTRSVVYERLENTEDIEEVEHQMENIKAKVGLSFHQRWKPYSCISIVVKMLGFLNKNGMELVMTSGCKECGGWWLKASLPLVPLVPVVGDATKLMWAGGMQPDLDSNTIGNHFKCSI